MLCDFGCGKKAEFQLKNGKHCCSKYSAQCEAIRIKNSSVLKKLKADKKIPIHYFTEEEREKSQKVIEEKAIQNAFIENSTAENTFIKKKLLSYFKWDNQCGNCQLSLWQQKEINLELHHLNGTNNDNRLENLQLLCPNCHSQTFNYKGKNANNGKEKVSEERFVEILKQSKSIRRALLNLKLSPKGANYERAKYLIDKYNINMVL